MAQQKKTYGFVEKIGIPLHLRINHNFPIKKQLGRYTPFSDTPKETIVNTYNSNICQIVEDTDDNSEDDDDDDDDDDGDDDNDDDDGADDGDDVLWWSMMIYDDMIWWSMMIYDDLWWYDMMIYD